MRHFGEVENRVSKEQTISRILEYGERCERIDPVEFESIYSPKEIRKDLECLAHTEKKIEEYKQGLTSYKREIYEINGERGRAFEILLADQIYNGEWLGSSAIPVRASRFDDVKNGVDIVVEFDREDEVERMALVVDASTSSDVGYMERKIKKNIDKVIKGSLEVRYFQSDISDENGEYFKGKLENLIPVVIGADRQNVNEIFDIFSELISLEGNKDDDSKSKRQWLRKKLSNHPIQDLFLNQIETQLKIYISILKREDKPTDDIEMLLGVIKEVVEEKKEIDFSEEINNDGVLYNIRAICEDLLNERSNIKGVNY